MVNDLEMTAKLADYLDVDRQLLYDHVGYLPRQVLKSGDNYII